MRRLRLNFKRPATGLAPHALRVGASFRGSKLALILALGVAWPAIPSPAQANGGGHRVESVVQLSGPVPGWDYIAIDTARHRLFLSRRAAGAQVFDVRTNKVIADIEQTKFANAFTLIPELNLGFVANQDGTATKFDLTTLKTLSKFKFGEDADTFLYDSATKQLVFSMSDSQALAFADPVKGVATGRLDMGPSKLEAMQVDGRGNYFVVDQKNNRIIRVDLRKRVVTASWAVPGCEQATGMSMDKVNRRLLIGCRGDKPVFAVMNADSGGVLNTYPIGAGNDGVVFEPKSKRVYFTNGVASNLVVYEQDSLDTYRLVDVITTVPYAKTIAVDADGGKIYSVTAQGRYNPEKPNRKDISEFYPNEWVDETFVVVTMSQK